MFNMAHQGVSYLPFSWYESDQKITTHLQALPRLSNVLPFQKDTAN